MLTAAMQSWFRRSETVPSAIGDSGAALPAAMPPPEPAARAAADAWPKERLSVTNQLWGDGFTMPGGELETLRLARPLGLSSASSLLLVGGGGGGPADSIVRNLGAWVTGLEAEPALVRQAQALMKAAQIGGKARIETWDPSEPNFEPRKFHHCLAIEPLRRGGEPAAILDGLSQTLKLGGQLVMTELVAAAPVTDSDVTLARWAKLENRSPTSLLAGTAITRMLSRVGFDVRIVEDVSDRHIQNAMIGWRVAVRDLRDNKPPPAVAAQIVAEAEIWLLRVRLLRQNRLRMMRWHAISKAPVRPPT